MATVEQPKSRKRGGRRSHGETQDCWKKRITAAKNGRKRYEMQWHLNQAFARGHHYLEWQPNERKLVFPSALKARMKRGIQLYKIDLLTQYLWTAISGLRGDGDFRPELGFIRDDLESEDFAEAANDALGFCWDNEADIDLALDDLFLILCTYGTGATRNRFDPTVGQVVQQDVVYLAGKPLLDLEEARAAVEASLTGTGPQVEIRDLKGQIVLERYSPFNLLPPPGIANPSKFPWEITVDARPLDLVVAEYPAADGMEGQDLASIDLVGLRDTAEYQSEYESEMGAGQLDDHVLVYTCFERPSRDYPEGCKAVLAGAEPTLLDVRHELDYRKPNGGEHRSGITYFHYWRNADVFWGKALLEGGIGSQRAYNTTRTQCREIISRGMPYVLEEEGAITASPKGLPMERVKLAPGRRPPQIVTGVGPGPWMVQEAAQIREDLAAAMGIRDVGLGENPENVGTYSQLVLLNENDRRKAEPITNRIRMGVNVFVENIVQDMRRYWPADKVIALEGESGLLESRTFTASKMPEGFYVKPMKGATLPRNQAAELAKVTEIAQYCSSIQMPLPPDWFKDSLDAGKPLPLPAVPADEQMEKARWENELILKALQQGAPPPMEKIAAQPWDDHQVHIPIHRTLQTRAWMADMPELVQIMDMLCEQHAQLQAQAEMTQMQTERQLGEADVLAQQSDQTPGPEDQELAERQAATEAGQQVEMKGAEAQIQAALQAATQPQGGEG